MIEKELFHELYKTATQVVVRHCAPGALSSLLHGYLSVFSMVRVYPWLERDYGNSWDIHERVREIARVLEVEVKKQERPIDERIGLVIDLMDVYQLYSDLHFLDTALDVAYDILFPGGTDKIVLPVRTANTCRLLSYCYYFTSEEACSTLARSLLKDGLEQSSEFENSELLAWWRAIQSYENIVDLTAGLYPDGVRERLESEVRRLESEEIERFCQSRRREESSFLRVFEFLAVREFSAYNELERVVSGGR